MVSWDLRYWVVVVGMMAVTMSWPDGSGVLVKGSYLVVGIVRYGEARREEKSCQFLYQYSCDHGILNHVCGTIIKQ